MQVSIAIFLRCVMAAAILWNLSEAADTQPTSLPRGASDHSHAAMLGRVEASIMGESALIDRNTGRVYWEGGSSNTLYESLAPKLDQYGAEHAQAALLTGLITLVFIGLLVGWIRGAIDQSDFEMQNNSLLYNMLLACLFRLPRIENKWLVLASVALYFLESYNCSTRRFLTNAISSPNEVEEYIESLRRELPVVTWKIKCFHYEKRKIFVITTLVRSFFRSLKNTNSDAVVPRTKNCPPMFPFTRKIVTHKSTTTYQYDRCLDSTIAGMWRRAAAIDTDVAPFTKIALTKLLVLSDRDSREDYFRQQSEFVREHGRGDVFAECSTDIQGKNFIVLTKKQGTT
jgi:hypothetical protein